MICAQAYCFRVLHGNNKLGWCPDHNTATKRAALLCGCGARLRFDNASGYCKPCSYRSPEFAAKQAAYYREGDNGQKMRAAAIRSYNTRKAENRGTLRGKTTHEMSMRGKHKRRAIEAAVFVEHVDLHVLLIAHSGICHLCGSPVGPDWHADHVIPIAMRGPHCFANMAPAHPRCNMLKSARWAGSPDVAVDAAARAAFCALHGHDLGASMELSTSTE